MDAGKQSQLNRLIDEAFKRAVVELANEATKIISKPRFWEGYNDVRDIVDLGQLRAAQQIVFTGDSSSLTAEIRYPVEYAKPVHEGATIRYANGNTRRIPSRPWLRLAAKRKPIDRSMSRYLK